MISRWQQQARWTAATPVLTYAAVQRVSADHTRMCGLSIGRTSAALSFPAASSGPSVQVCILGSMAYTQLHSTTSTTSEKLTLQPATDSQGTNDIVVGNDIPLDSKAATNTSDIKPVSAIAAIDSNVGQVASVALHQQQDQSKYSHSKHNKVKPNIESSLDPLVATNAVSGKSITEKKPSNSANPNDLANKIELAINNNNNHLALRLYNQIPTTDINTLTRIPSSTFTKLMYTAYTTSPSKKTFQEPPYPFPDQATHVLHILNTMAAINIAPNFIGLKLAMKIYASRLDLIEVEKIYNQIHKRNFNIIDPSVLRFQCLTHIACRNEQRGFEFFDKWVQTNYTRYPYDCVIFTATASRNREAIDIILKKLQLANISMSTAGFHSLCEYFIGLCSGASLDDAGMKLLSRSDQVPLTIRQIILTRLLNTSCNYSDVVNRVSQLRAQGSWLDNALRTEETIAFARMGNSQDAWRSYHELDTLSIRLLTFMAKMVGTLNGYSLLFSLTFINQSAGRRPADTLYALMRGYMFLGDVKSCQTILGYVADTLSTIPELMYSQILMAYCHCGDIHGALDYATYLYFRKIPIKSNVWPEFLLATITHAPGLIGDVVTFIATNHPRVHVSKELEAARVLLESRASTKFDLE
ncbi:hypothetical protein BASA50_008507 [Batrachochytrium salamandrivorans]|uniref:Pentatricopeptide repeat domain-containing protein n=1 Tax=Batrachochytrium salamandrivorans TaxID=1357716 RepID=A0ABQ8F4I3_9FUNG|nr:hypothetical protein BASA50_008507 [Batrachochytrium salamandrivorans]